MWRPKSSSWASWRPPRNCGAPSTFEGATFEPSKCAWIREVSVRGAGGSAKALPHRRRRPRTATRCHGYQMLSARVVARAALGRVAGPGVAAASPGARRIRRERAALLAAAALDANVVGHVAHAGDRVADLLDGVLVLAIRHGAGERDLTFADLDLDVARIDVGLHHQRVADILADALVRPLVAFRALAGETSALVGLPVAVLSGLA